ncbi:MAG: hypothetical protein EHM28_11635 [Spirochaetaceae bacterium]|nr:MAG: hypothetical protein EHM28_11635 [Spirochaetaceae bacterium]
MDVDIHPDNFKIARDPDSVNILLPRHRSLYDFTAFQPLHHDFVNNRIMILAGQNLFVGKLNMALRSYGGFVFLREDSCLTCENHPQAFLDKDFYFKNVLPLYLKQQVFCSSPEKHDLMIFLEYEKDTRTGKNNGGRSKTGELRQINWAMIKLLYDLARANNIKAYITPVNIGFSKIPDAPFTVHPPGPGSTTRALRYFFEQRFVYHKYPKYAGIHKQARVREVSRYGKPELLSDMDFPSLRAFKRYAEDFRARMGGLETVFPIHLICKAMGQHEIIHLKTLDDKLFHFHEHFKKENVRFVDVEDSRGNVLPIEELAKKTVDHLNATPDPHAGGPGRGGRMFSLKKNYLQSHDLKLQIWYANNILHFDKKADDFYV